MHKNVYYNIFIKHTTMQFSIALKQVQLLTQYNSNNNTQSKMQFRAQNEIMNFWKINIKKKNSTIQIERYFCTARFWVFIISNKRGLLLCQFLSECIMAPPPFPFLSLKNWNGSMVKIDFFVCCLSFSKWCILFAVHNAFF